jgi:hypothetical protein
MTERTWLNRETPRNSYKKLTRRRLTYIIDEKNYQRFVKASDSQGITMSKIVNRAIHNYCDSLGIPY